MDKLVENALQLQLNRERYNCQVYHFLGHTLDCLAWEGFSKFMHKAAGEEQDHANRFAEYLAARNVFPRYDQIELINMVGDPQSAFKAIYDLEVQTTYNINELYVTADDANDPQTCQFLQWFLNEQTESVKQTLDMLMEINRADDNAALLLLSEKYGEL